MVFAEAMSALSKKAPVMFQRMKETRISWVSASLIAPGTRDNKKVFLSDGSEPSAAPSNTITSPLGFTVELI